jgi:phenylpropionate dioxygenase-like ring-hydroxylating dioxygenase large terminal subunit
VKHEWPAGLIRAWHPIAYRHELKQGPLAVRLMDRALVLFAGEDGLALLEDRCPHRNVPLSAGRVCAGQIECPYHGWRFDGAGQCRKVAGSATPALVSARAYPVREQAGLVWTTLAETPKAMPSLPGEVFDAGYDSFWWHLPASPGAIGDAIENLLDPIHSYFLHPGLVRQTREPEGVEMAFTSTSNTASARYTEPGRALTLLQRLTEGKRTHSWGHYRAPSQVQIAFEDAQGVHAAISVVFSPVGSGETRPYACFSTRKGWAPAWLKRAFIVAFHRKVLSQDLAMLKLQGEQTARFGGPDYHHGPLDLFGPAIWAGLNGRPLAELKRTLTLSSNPVAARPG